MPEARSSSSAGAKGRPHSPTSVAVIPWGDWIEDFLDGIGQDVEGFCEEVTGGWLFGYVEALIAAGFAPFLVTVSRAVRRPERRIHRHSGVPVWLLPSPAAYRLLRKSLTDPYATSRASATSGLPVGRRVIGAAARHVAPYLAWPAGHFGNVLNREGADIILTQEYEYARFDVLVAQARRHAIPIFASFQGGTWHTSRIESLLRPQSLRHADGIIVASEAEAKRVQAAYGLPTRRIHRIFNPLDVTAWTMPERATARARLGIPPSAMVAAWHGRIAYQPKGIDVLLAAWERHLKHSDGDSRLMMVGTGADAPRLHADLKQRQIPGVEWRDEYVTDKREIREVLAAADIYVFPSRHEGFPVALVEALASGLPVVAADAPGVREIMGADEGADVGRLVAVGDADTLADGIAELFQDAQLRERLGRHARQRAESRFAPEAIGEQLRTMITGDRPAS